MSEVKHSVNTDALATLGSIIGDSEKRDAIHLAVEPVTAAHALRPGEDVGFVDGGVGLCANPVGIVDPFLKEFVQKGQRFWLIIYPRKITSLRHVWEHPGFPNETQTAPDALVVPGKVAAEKWLRDFANRAYMPYEDVITAARDFLETGRYFDQHAHESARNAIFEDGALEQFWRNYEAITGTTVPAEDREGYIFSCSC